jgi:hypothetical protein
MSLSWSFSAEKCFRRCQRQYYFREFAACHNATREPWRRELHILKQLKTVELWQGNLVHRGIERFVVPCLKSGQPIDWRNAIQATQEMAHRQLEFSASHRYRDPTISKKEAGDDFCALWPHERDEGVTLDDLQKVLDTITQAFTNLSQLEALWDRLRGQTGFLAEVRLNTNYDGAAIEAYVDVLSFRGTALPTIIDWKVSESFGGSDAHHQTAFYAWMLRRCRPSWIGKAEDVQLLEVQLLKPAVFEHRCSEDAFDGLEDRIYRELNDLRLLCGEGHFADPEINDFAYAQNPNSCRYCSFQKICSTPPALMANAEEKRPTQLSLFD